MGNQVTKTPRGNVRAPTIACAIGGAAALVLLLKLLWEGETVSGIVVTLLAGLVAVSLALLCWVEARSPAGGRQAAGPVPGPLWFTVERTLVTLGYFALFGALALHDPGSTRQASGTSPLLVALTGGLGVVLTAWFGSHRDATNQSTPANPPGKPEP